MPLDLLDPKNCTSFKAKRFARLVAREFDAHLANVGLKSTQFTILLHVHRRGPLTAGDLSALVGLEASTLTRNLRPLMDHGWIVQRPGQDARSRWVSITPDGEQMIEKATVHWRIAQAQVNQTIGGQVILQIHALMDAAMDKLPAAATNNQNEKLKPVAQAR
jgi:DNA-binding MarR family transcriptional regulator